MKNKPLSGKKDQAWVFFGITLKLQLASLMVSIAVAQILFGFLVLLGLYLYVKGERYKQTALDIPILIFILARVISVITAANPSLSVHSIPRELIFYSSYFLVVFYLQHTDETERNNILKWLFISSAIVGVIAAGRTIAGYTVRANGLTGGGTLATHMTLTIIAAVCLKENKSIFPLRSWFWAVLLSLVAGLAFTLTRGDWIATATAIFIYGLFVNRKIVLGLLAFVAVVVIAVPFARERLATLTHPLEHTSDRLVLWQNAVKHAGEHPILGHGPDTFHSVFDDLPLIGDKGIASWHNDTIQLYMESGLLGLLSYAGLLAAAFWISIKLLLMQKQTKARSAIGWMGVLMLIAYVIVGMFTAPSGSITNGMLFRFLLAFVAVKYSERVAA